MPWKNNSPDPIEDRRRQLEEMERRLAEQRRKLTEDLHGPPAAKQKAAEPPVWRMEESDRPRERSADPSPARKRHLARQRRRDMMLFFIFIALLLVVVVIVLLVYAHNSGPATAA